MAKPPPSSRRTPAPKAPARKPARKAPAKASEKKPGKLKAKTGKQPGKLKPKTGKANNYDRHRRRVAEKARAQSNLDRELGAIPPPADPARRSACEADLRVALETYFPETFALGWSSQHLEVIRTAQRVLRDGGLYAIGMARGSGKTAITVRVSMLALLFGWRRYLVLLGASQDAASEMVDSIKTELENNALLLADFPEVCLPIRALEGIAQRAKGQTVDGINTAIRWNGRRRLVLPTVAGSKASGACLQAVGILGRIRGMVHLTQDGRTVRPDCFIGDDLQTDQSAKKAAQVERRESIINGAVLGLAGPSKRMSGLITITVQRLGDLADRLLNPKISPQWQPRRYSLVEAWPENMALWERYAELREEDLAAGRDHLTKARDYYRDHREEMDRGAIVPWAERHEPHELSALQSAFNLRLRNQVTFDAEYQNTPTESVSGVGTMATYDSDSIVRRVNGYRRGEIPAEATHLFAGVDVQKDVLFWLVAAIAQDFTGYVVDYGSWPDQPGAHYWTLSTIQHTIAQATGHRSLEAGLFAALNRLTAELFSRTWTRDDGAAIRPDRLIVDANWGPSTKTVYSFARQASHPVLAFHGRGITAKQTPLAQRKRRTGEQAGLEWYIPSTKGTKQPRHVISDVNLVKTCLRERLLTPLGDPGAWSLFRADAGRHRMIADHLCAEYPVETSGRGRDLLEWAALPGRDNHWLDCLVMAATGGLIAGLSPDGASVGRPAAQRKRISLREAYQKRRQA